MYGPDSFDNVEVLRVGVTGPSGANTLFIVSGVALLHFQGTGTDWHRDDLSFVLPGEGTGNPAALDIGAGFVDSVVAAFPATIQSTSGQDVGWGIDTVDTTVESNHIRVVARTVVRNPAGVILRMGFHVSVLSHV